MLRFVCVLLLFCSTLLCCSSAVYLQNFTNPIMSSRFPNPSILKVEQSYYLTFDTITGYEIVLYKSAYFTDFKYAEKKTVYTAPGGYSQLQNSNLQNVNGELFIYFSMVNETDNIPRLYAIQAKDPKNPFGRWNAPTRLLENIWDPPAFNGAVMSHNQSNYLVFTSNHNFTNGSHYRSLFIARMNSPTDVVEPVMLLKFPSESWECEGLCSNDAPATFNKNDVTYLVFSAGSAEYPGTSLSYMSISSNHDPMEGSNWEFAPGSVFSKDDSEKVYAVGHPSFTTSLDDMEIWMVYHGSINNQYIRRNFAVRAEKIKFDNGNGKPIFPKPHGFSNSQSRPSGEPDMFTNPIFEGYAQETGVIRLGEYYYMPSFDKSGVAIFKSKTLADFQNAENKIVIPLPRGQRQMYGHTLKMINGSLYLYSSTYDGGMAKLVAFQATNASDPMGTWGPPVDILKDVWPKFSEYGTVMEHNGQLYFAWISKNGTSNIYMAPMINPAKAVEPVVLVAQPRRPWECVGRYCALDAPNFLYRNNLTYMFFSASDNRSPDLCLEYMTIEAGKDPLEVSNWLSIPRPVFWRNDPETVFNTGKASFTTSPDGTETWLVYRASDLANFVTSNQFVRIEKITWNESDGTPIFPRPSGRDHPQPVPSSMVEVEMVSNSVGEDMVVDTAHVTNEAN